MRLPRGARIYLALVVFAASGLLAGWLAAERETRPAPLGLLTLLLALAVAAQHFPLAVAPGYKVNAAIAVYFAALLLLDTPTVLLLTAAGQLLGGGMLFLRRDPATGRRRRGLPGVLFNAAQLVLALGLGALVYAALLPRRTVTPLDAPADLWALLAAAATIHLVTTWAVATMTGLQRGRAPWAVWRAAQRLELPEAVGLFALGLVTALLAGHHPWAPLLLVLPAAALHWALGRSLRLHQEAARAAAELRAVLESVEQGVLMTDRSGRVRVANRCLGELLALDTEELLGRPWPAVAETRLTGQLHDPAPALARLAWLAAHPEEARTDEVAVDRPVPRVLACYSGPVYAANGKHPPPAEEIIGHIEVYTDVTEARRLARAKDEFLATVSHELRTPLMTVGGYLELVEAQLAGAGQPDSARLAGYVSTARDELARLRRLSEDLLAVTRLQIGRLALRPTPTDLGALVRETVARFAAPPNVAARGHRLVCRAPEPLPGHYDGQRLTQVLTNLLENALKYTPRGGEVTVTAERAGAEAVVSVRDQGIGIPPGERHQLFQPFSRASNAQAGSAEGLGLGLYISRGIVEGHGGRLWVEDAPGGGSIFRFALPLDERAATAGLQAAGVSGGSGDQAGRPRL